ncbi:hypothetical protein CDAR_473811 [Caerostris darwini]|uniref:Uncharacterized protein n=1 Tax=Caerostris darwini TaxID=1538125 RepID=A0AAV4PCP1_9ARAC|nr:hypothetical protein CDAR_473811 [Caerostris darwini]
MKLKQKIWKNHSQKSEACGTGFFSLVVQGSIVVDKFASNFDGEVAVISKAGRGIVPLPGTKTVVTQSRQCRPKTTTTKNDNFLTNKMRSRCNGSQATAMCREKKANALTNQGCNMNEPNRPVPYRASCSTINRTVTNYVNNARKQPTKYKRRENLNIPKDLLTTTTPHHITVPRAELPLYSLGEKSD